MINQYAFWEIRGGTNAKFWEDGWQQKGKMKEIQTLQEIQQRAQSVGMENVRDYWADEESSGIWRTWRKPGEWCENINTELEDIYLKEMDLRKIKKQDRVGHPKMGQIDERGFHSKRGLLPDNKEKSGRGRFRLEEDLGRKMVAKNHNLRLVGSQRKDPNLGQNPKERLSRTIKM